MSDAKVKISAETAEAERALKALGSEVVGLSGKMGSLTGVAGALGGALSVSAFAGFIKSNIDAADHLGDLGKTTKLTVEQLAGVSLAAKQSGSDLDGTALSISKLAENMGNDSEKFAKLGITAKDPIEAFKQLADVFNAIQDPQQQAAFGAAALGKSWRDAAPLLAEGSQRIGEMIARGTALSGNVKDAAEQADKFNDQLAEMQTQAGGFGITLANVALPSMTKTATAMNDLAREGHPVLALWRGLAGMGQIAWDFLFPPENLAESMKSANRVKELKEELFDMERHLRTVKGGGMVSRALYGDQGELERQIAMIKAQIATIEKHAAELDKKPTSAPQGATPTGVAGFIGGESQGKIDAEIERQQAKYDKLHEMAMLADATDMERAYIKEQFDLAAMDREYQAIEEHGVSTAELYASYQKARIEREQMPVDEVRRIREKDDLDLVKSMRALFKFKESMRISDLGNSLDLLAKGTAGMALHSKRAFEINKIATIANIMVKAPGIVTNAYDSGLKETGSIWGGAAYAAAAAIATAAQLSAAQSATYGGGGSVAPALGGTAGVPASTAASQASSSSTQTGTAAAPAQQFNLTLHGIDPNSQNAQFTYDQVFNQLMPLIGEANGNGATEMNIIFA